MHSSTLSRTSSVASISSDDALTRRTRKRFSSMQLMMLEQLFHQSSHPTREEREAVAKAAGMEMKSVTIWFQNKRQMERKALHHATVQPADAHRTAPCPSSSSCVFSANASTSTSAAAPACPATHPIRTHTHTLSTHTPRHKITPPRTRPSLDRVATRSESRLPPPRTPTRPRNPHASPWDNMPSSPLAPPASPPAHDLVEFLGGSRTLEWACAAARLAGKEGRQTSAHERDAGEAWDRDRDRDQDQRRSKDRDRDGGGEGEGEGELTEEDDVEAVTPEGSLGASDGARWRGHRAQRPRPRLTISRASTAEEDHGKWLYSHDEKPSEEGPQDEDTMHAALALCGLGRRSG